MEVGGGANGRLIAVAKTPDKSKRDEWSEGGVMSLLDVYEAKWTLRNRAKLKGSDWEDIARQVSARGSGKSAKTPNQCKNKVEAMKKRYRIESAVSNHSASVQSWQFYARMNRLVKGTHCLEPKVGDLVASEVEGAGAGAGTGSLQPLPNILEGLENDTKKVNDNGPANAHPVEKAQIFNAVDEDGQGHVQDSNQDDGSNTVPNNGEFSSPRKKAAHVGERLLNINPPKRRKHAGSNVAESIQMLAHSMLKVEQARMEMYRDLERLHTEAEIKRAEMDLKKTEIIATTQLQIAKLFVKRFCTHNNKSGGSSLVADHVIGANAEGKNG